MRQNKLEVNNTALQANAPGATLVRSVNDKSGLIPLKLKLGPTGNSAGYYDSAVCQSPVWDNGLLWAQRGLDKGYVNRQVCSFVRITPAIFNNS
ncbi:unnamed protein product [Leptosia nina]|uniref:Uncharacterized protein n=1 Tax=Leptosia nina TaxID=320188 RepID=A0AAV1J4C6_9NEOP